MGTHRAPPMHRSLPRLPAALLLFPRLGAGAACQAVMAGFDEEGYLKPITGKYADHGHSCA